ncbi:gene transfer agent family protein [Enterovirga sp.]|uniref:gene transfer agent family protein n=1 Tax=Enterovirga sp. TaxID=2026350 RepID=UPI002637AD32|nr:gene transfer agent family protein [Enterovirga sp.]MDB5592163.1 transfer agent family protein [Enterovirga sp.]
MANRRRGEVSATVGGRHYTLCLTLGSLAELEDAFGVEDLGALAARFGSGRLSSSDLVRIFAAGLRGAGQAVGEDEIRAVPVADGLGDIAAAVAALLEATFGGASPPDPLGPQAP